MRETLDMPASELDEHFLRRSFDVARRALTHGNHPFGAILVDEHSNVLIEAENGYMPAHDGDAGLHDAERRCPEECHALFVRRTLRDVRGRDLLGGNWPPGLRPERT